MNASANPLLDFSDLPRFDLVRPEHVAPAIEALLRDARDAVERAASAAAEPSWASVVAPTETAFDHLDRAWSAVRHLNAVVSTPEIRTAYNSALPKVTAFRADVAQDARLFERFRALAGSRAFASLAPAQRKVVENALRDFRLGGAELPEAGKARFKAIEEALSAASATFRDNVLDSENAWAHYVDGAQALAGVPADVVARARSDAEADGRAGCKLTLRQPCYVPVMQYADDRALRATMHRAFSTRASDLGEPQALDNTDVLLRILALRDEAARLLGYANYAEVSLVPKMARTPAEVIAFLRDLARRARPYAEREYAELRAFARDTLGIADLAAWDLAYASEKLKAQRFAYSDEEVRQYFPEDRVLAGLFHVVETLYGVEVRPASAPAWHPDVRFFEIVDRDGGPVGRFYVDLYAREGKRSGAWMDDAIDRREVDGRVQRPVAYLTCNFAGPVNGARPHFTHREVITLFHEFGHGLHQLLTRVDVAGVSGLRGVEWDAVELSSQFMENYCWQWDVLSRMTAHAQTGGPLPRALFDRMLAARNFGGGLAMLRQAELALSDMRAHSDFVPGGADAFGRLRALQEDVRREVAVVPRPPYDRVLHSFAHIFDGGFGGGYAAGYYSYKWAEVLSADAFGLFEEKGVLSPEIGARFRDEILARGGSRSALESFVAFRGRPPSLDALLRHHGMSAAPSPP